MLRVQGIGEAPGELLDLLPVLKPRGSRLDHGVLYLSVVDCCMPVAFNTVNSPSDVGQLENSSIAPVVTCPNNIPRRLEHRITECLRDPADSFWSPTRAGSA